ncbi:undecaprenyl-diphosphate phosphatase [Sulfoacidibacillus thermotolerans]|uniref:Undecaprenyl-diphosphatase n=1 Tax=Sulfoacidibacillus thermotolerans TaxID=1765684 RepID=A0A2U3D709_SULT2|nr:undecaprenyl-diphosphate phosphatase [Sulfoacidibacillus thermotolerans]PWI57065.1 hypothetical protein BM613_10460 [Sulfoacidibacillus thermotolerans]
MSLFQALLLGTVQGFTEFLPISSSGHLVLVQHLLHWKGDSLTFDVFLHFGTLLAVLIALRKELRELALHPFSRLTILLTLSTLPTVAIGLLFEKTFESIFHSGATLGIEFFLTGTLLLYVESLPPKKVPTLARDMHYQSAFWIGLAQGAAIFPALSRSGLTLCTALGLGIDRSEAVRYSFLLSVPIILGASLFKLKNVAAMHFLLSPALFIGMGSSALTGYLAIRFLLKFIAKASLRPFGVYTILLGVLIMSDQWIFHRFF